MMPETTSITDVAEAFFDACETGKGWQVCGAYCTPNATFSAQAEPLLDLKTLAQYTDWMRGMLTVLPDARYELKSFATDTQGTMSLPTEFSMERIPDKVGRFLLPVERSARIMST